MLTQKDFHFKRIYWLHFIPFAASVIYFFPFYAESAAYKIDFNLKSYTQFPSLWLNFSIVASLQAVPYIIVTILLVQQLAKADASAFRTANTQDSFSDDF